MIKKEKYSIYQKNYDITFIMIDTLFDDLVFSTECVGWYHGEPTKEDNELFTGKLKATFAFGERGTK